MSFILAIDGPAGSGKGTVTKLVGKKLGLINVDTGAMYRCVTLDCLNKNIAPEELDKIEKMTAMNVLNMEIVVKGVNVENKK